jgi:hypothetical protein
MLPAFIAATPPDDAGIEQDVAQRASGPDNRYTFAPPRLNHVDPPATEKVSSNEYNEERYIIGLIVLMFALLLVPAFLVGGLAYFF